MNDELAENLEEAPENAIEAAEDTIETLRRDIDAMGARLDAMEADFHENTQFQPRAQDEVINNTAPAAQQEVSVEPREADPYLKELQPTRKHGIFHSVHR